MAEVEALIEQAQEDLETVLFSLVGDREDLRAENEKLRSELTALCRDKERLEWCFRRYNTAVVSIPCPDGIEGCLVAHNRPMTIEEIRAAIDAAMKQHTQHATAALRAELEEAKKELAACRHHLGDHTRQLVSEVDNREQLEQELTALRRDSARYRYLRQHWDDWTGTTWHLGNIPEKLDAAIDAAMEGQP